MKKEMNVSGAIKKEVSIVGLDSQEKKRIDFESKLVVSAIKREIKKRGIVADVFIGGSLAKDTMIAKKNYDIDVFVRFDRNNKEISNLLAEIVKSVSLEIGGEFLQVHGSRDYFRIGRGDLCFEIIPVIKIKKASEAENITDLSYFHVFYVKKKMKKGLADQIKLAKKFCYAQNCYGAESYIQGFSGYALELLIIYYGSFLKFVKNVAASKGKIIIDIEKFYKNKEAIMREMNESKLQSPIIFVDPTHRERNALAALSEETYEKFKVVCKNFLKKPSLEFFEEKTIDLRGMMAVANKRKANFVEINIETDRQKGDIAGTKLLKFSILLTSKIERYFDVLRREFEYGGENSGKSYLVVKKKDFIVIKGPPINNVANLKEFKKIHPGAYVQGDRAYSKEKVNLSIEKFLEYFAKKERSVIRDMGITKLDWKF